MTDTTTENRVQGNMPRRAMLATGATIAAGGVAVLATGERVEAARRRPFGGAYYVLAEAPYGPHLMSFTPDGLMLSTNPTNVQDGPSSSVKVTDSVGMGSWRWDGQEHVLITMVQENALQPTRTRGPRLHVSARVRVDRRGDFRGPAIAEILDMVGDTGDVASVIEHPRSYLTGTRLVERFDRLDRADRAYLWRG